VVLWEVQAGVFRLKMLAMVGPDRCVQVQNVVPWEDQTGVFRLIMLCHWRPRPVCLGSTFCAMVDPDWCV